MTRDEMIAAIEGEIARLEQVRELLRCSTNDRFGPVEGQGPVVKKQRILSAEARRKIAQAQKRRWAKHRKEKSLAVEVA